MNMSAIETKHNLKNRFVTQRIKCNRFSHYFSTYNSHYYSPELAKILEDPDHSIMSPYLKNDATTTLSLITLNEQTFVIKRYNIKGIWHGIKRAFQSTRAARCWRSAHYLLQQGIATPKPIAMIECRIGCFRREGYFIYEHIPGPQGFDVFRDEPADEVVTMERAENTVALIKKLQYAKICHGDMKASNFIYNNTKPYFIDLDSMRRYRFACTFKKKKQKEIVRFLRNWTDPVVRSVFEKLLVK